MRNVCNIYSRRGAVLIYVAVAMIAFTALTSLVIDIAHLRVVKTQLQFAADSAARNAAVGLSSGSAKNNAIAAAALMNADGSSVVLQPTDIVIGTWSTSGFSPGGASPNAVKVTAARSAARGNAVPVWGGAIIGKTSAGVTATAPATGKAPP